MRHSVPSIALLLALTLLTACAGLASPGERGNYSEYYPKALRGAPASAYYQNPTQIDLLEAAADGDAGAMQAALAAGADVNAVGQDGLLPLYWVMAQGSLKGTQWLLDHGADPNRYSAMPADWRSKRETPLSLAVRLEQPEFLDALLEHGGDPNQTPFGGGRSLIFKTIVPRRPENTKILIEYGADVNFQTPKFQNTPFLKSITAQMYDISTMLLKAGADPAEPSDVAQDIVYILKNFGNRSPYKASYEAYPHVIEALQKRGMIPADFEYDPQHPMKTW